MFSFLLNPAALLSPNNRLTASCVRSGQVEKFDASCSPRNTKETIGRVDE